MKEKFNAAEDYDRVLYADARIFVSGLRDKNAALGRKAVRYVKQRTLDYVGRDIIDRDQIRREVFEDAEEEYGRALGLPVLTALVAWEVGCVLDRIWGKK